MIATATTDGIAELVMDRPPANALNTALVGRLADAHRAACDGGARAIIVTGRPGMFSGGIDVPELLLLPRPAIAEFWTAFFRLMHRLASSPVPVIAAVSGHAPAGGAVLAIHCDYRVGARGPFKIGLNEVAVGLPVPDGIIVALEHLVGARQAQRLAMTAQLVSADEAVASGLFDELAEPGQLMERSRDVARQLTSLPPIAMNRTRLQARSRLIGMLDPDADARRATEAWFSDETQAGMRALLQRLAKK